MWFRGSKRLFSFFRPFSACEGRFAGLTAGSKSTTWYDHVNKFRINDGSSYTEQWANLITPATGKATVCSQKTGSRMVSVAGTMSGNTRIDEMDYIDLADDGGATSDFGNMITVLNAHITIANAVKAFRFGGNDGSQTDVIGTWRFSVPANEASAGTLSETMSALAGYAVDCIGILVGGVDGTTGGDGTTFREEIMKFNLSVGVMINENFGTQTPSNSNQGVGINETFAIAHSGSRDVYHQNIYRFCFRGSSAVTRFFGTVGVPRSTQATASSQTTAIFPFGQNAALGNTDVITQVKFATMSNDKSFATNSLAGANTSGYGGTP